MDPKVFLTINGHQSDALPVSDRGFSYGHGLFETLLYHDSALPLFDRHISRLFHDARLLAITLDEGEVIRYIREFLALLHSRDYRYGTVKIVVTAGSGTRGYQTPEQQESRVICQYFPFQADGSPGDKMQYQEGVKLWQCDYRLPANRQLAGIKHLNRLDQVLARTEWRDETFVDGIVMNQSGLLIESTSANIFCRFGREWLTPSLEEAGVAGIMRSLLIEEIFPLLQLPVKISAIPLEQMEKCEEVFICNSVKGVIPVTCVKEIAQWSVGEQTKMVQSALAEKYPAFHD